MPRFSLLSFLIAISVLAAILALISTPRGHINRTTFNLLENGMTLDEASAIIGIGPGINDGIERAYGLPGYITKYVGYSFIYWANANGAIVARVGPGEREAQLIELQFIPPRDLEMSVSYKARLYDRTIQRIDESPSILATAFFPIAAFVASIFPVLIAAWIFKVDLREIIVFSSVIGFGIAAWFFFYTGQMESDHKLIRDFPVLCKLVAASGFFSAASLFALRKLAKRPLRESDAPIQIESRTETT